MALVCTELSLQLYEDGNLKLMSKRNILDFSTCFKKLSLLTQSLLQLL